MNKEKTARIRIVRTIKVVGHPCKACELTDPPVVFEGVVKDSGIEWPGAFGYRIGYCPHCGEKLPTRLEPAVKKRDPLPW